MADFKGSNKEITIVLDPGHGATYNKWNTVDPGALGPDGKNEKDYTLEISARLGAELEKTYGYTVAYTRHADITAKQIHLRWRVDFAHKHNADYFISIHLDSFAATKNHFAAYYWHRGGTFSKEGKKFAESVSAAVTPRGFTKSNVKSANHFVTRNVNVPAILVECGNINNKDNAAEISNKQFVKEFAKGIDNYIQGSE
jgi:N-acetylmuramoyl-L-alanine amidase